MSWQVLIVEDDDEIREELAAILRVRGFKTIEASNGNEALDTVRRYGVRPSVVLLDLMMPVLDGYGFMEAQAAHPWLADVPVVLVTAAQPPRKIAQANVRSVVSKPIDLPHLLSVIRDACATPLRGAPSR